MRLVIALGGNALLRNGESPEAQTQTDRLTSIAPALASLADNNELVLVHGNGPQVGLLALENIADTSIATPYPLSDMVAESQGLIGAWIQRSLLNAEATRPVVTVISQTVVDRDDPGWLTPSKYIGPVYTTAESQMLAKRYGWTFRGEHAGFRRVVASPVPLEVVEQSTIVHLLDAGITVVAGGGGGIPTTKIDGRLRPVDAVVDKDAVASLLAVNLNADLLVILTDVPGIMAAFGTPDQQVISSATSASLSAEVFNAGTMRPKVLAAIGFADSTGRRAAIGSLDDIEAVVHGKAGTQIRPSAAGT